jgi:predicted outer membrane protein
MAIAGMAEVQLGKLASDRAADADVKAFGQMMVTDHTKASGELLQLASGAGVQPPKQLDAKHQQLVDKLSKLRGAEFDREYVSAMVMGHEEVVAMLRSQSRGGPDVIHATLHRWCCRHVGWRTHRERQRRAQWPADVTASGSRWRRRLRVR